MPLSPPLHLLCSLLLPLQQSSSTLGHVPLTMDILLQPNNHIYVMNLHVCKTKSAPNVPVSSAHLKEESYSAFGFQLALFSTWFQSFSLSCFFFGFGLLFWQIWGLHSQVQLL